MICAQYVICWTGPPVTPTGTALQLERGVGRHQCCSQPAQVHCVHFNHLVCVPSFFALIPLSSFLSFSPVSPTPSLPPSFLSLLSHLLPPFLLPSLTHSLTPSLLSSCSHVHVHQQGHLWQNYTYHLSSLLPPFTFTSSLSLAPPVHCDSNLLSMTALLGDPLILSRTLMTLSSAYLLIRSLTLTSPLAPQ